MLGYQHIAPAHPLPWIGCVKRALPHRYFGVLAPNSLLRVAVTALAAPMLPATAQAEPVTAGEGVPGVAPLGHTTPPTPEPAPPKRSPAHYLWAVLIARFLSPCGTDRSYAQRTSSVPN